MRRRDIRRTWRHIAHHGVLAQEDAWAGDEDLTVTGRVAGGRMPPRSGVLGVGHQGAAPLHDVTVVAGQDNDPVGAAGRVQQHREVLHVSIDHAVPPGSSLCRVLSTVLSTTPTTRTPGSAIAEATSGGSAAPAGTQVILVEDRGAAPERCHEMLLGLRWIADAGRAGEAGAGALREGGQRRPQCLTRPQLGIDQFRPSAGGHALGDLGEHCGAHAIDHDQQHAPIAGAGARRAG